MLSKSDLFPNNFDWKEYSKKECLVSILGKHSEDLEDLKDKKNISLETVNPENQIPFEAEFDDLARLHHLVISRKVTTILEFGVGKSSIIFADAIKKNKLNFFDYSRKALRRENLYECHSIDNYDEWINECYEKVPQDFFEKNILFFHKANLIISDFNGRVCSFYDPIPNICPDLIYLDGPDQFSARGSVRGISTAHQDRMPMSGDILSFEHFLQPGTLIVVDGRTANARFLVSNLQRNWAYYYSEEFDQHFFELQEQPLGIYNKVHIEHCLGDSYFSRSNI